MTSADEKSAPVVEVHRHLDPNIPAEAHAWVDSLAPDEYERAQAKLKRKIDIRILPTLFILLVLNYLDRNAVPLARVQGIDKDLGLVGTQFNTVISVFFAGYIIGQVPSNILLSRSPPSLYLPAFVILWGTVSASAAAVNDYSHLVVVRFFLGVTEAPFFPGILFFLSSWYTKRELALRTSILYTGAHLSGAFAGLIAAGIQNGLHMARGLESWRWLFIIEGVLTVFCGLLAAVILPNWPATTRWLSDREKALAAARLERDVGMSDDEYMPLGAAIKEALKDYKMWLMGLIYCMMTTAGGYSAFVPTVVATFGKSRVQTLLLTAPPYLVPAVTEILVSFSSDRRPERCFHYTIPMVLGIIGFIIAATTTTTAPRYLSIFFMTGGMSSSFTVLLAWVGSTFPRPRAKRAVAYGTVNALGNIAQIWSPYFYPKSDGPRYVKAFIINACFTAGAIALSFVLRECLRRENKRMDERESDDDSDILKKRIRYVL
ncbi:hypothetical protein CcaverHIS002_0510760 [Cutaneotrichosporon cavernicola]|uniref:Major facilitator superfamily (MFS) profile domain-containing protein n=1 Tax=Cutaneotrichosporon cavernicola TaxID=279322 RepID=A0AA48L7Q1_9TREE|nr:uncharacterized protein CcaverHIS019_0511320 [Cutaneotrichosporon cavernicola]BEI85675.1 hypothetical protein CcaverHIS002_0510760 [Cutaneotrichosporon cavernicola]BEI93504.1 hypothetical protein CcaverHIS019_0511320 [Cutaneotrichosporon cavernicola]BEJ01283.1 hypothetical protein CcaverHIS631_0511400 [Cutaneotrichosporon cavernicola]BEJ09050.1 hypothetical protein CcaverHIS641_0511440 [Cutaneotrichosporon cavernicola]